MHFLAALSLVVIIMDYAQGPVHGSGDDGELGLTAVMRYLKCQGPLLAICQDLKAPSLIKQLSRGRDQTVMAFNTFDANVVRYNVQPVFKSFLLCGDSMPLNQTVAALKWAKQNFGGATGTWLVTCSRSSCLEMAKFDFISPGERVFFFNMDSRDIFESYTINGLIRTTVFDSGDLRAQGNIKYNDLEATFIQRRSDLHGTELRTLVSRYVNIFS